MTAPSRRISIRGGQYRPTQSTCQHPVVQVWPSTLGKRQQLARKKTRYRQDGCILTKRKAPTDGSKMGEHGNYLISIFISHNFSGREFLRRTYPRLSRRARPIPSIINGQRDASYDFEGQSDAYPYANRQEVLEKS